MEPISGVLQQATCRARVRLVIANGWDVVPTVWSGGGITLTGRGRGRGRGQQEELLDGWVWRIGKRLQKSLDSTTNTPLH